MPAEAESRIIFDPISQLKAMGASRPKIAVILSGAEALRSAVEGPLTFPRAEGVRSVVRPSHQTTSARN